MEPSQVCEPALGLVSFPGAEPMVGIAELEAAIERHILEFQTEAEFRVPAGAGRLLAFLADRGTILNREYDDDFVALRVRLGRADLARAGRLLDALKPTSAEE